MKQTAVEWLEQEMLKPNLSMKEILEQAKEIEKEHIKFAYNNGAQDIFEGKYKAMEDYYNKNYGGKNEI